MKSKDTPEIACLRQPDYLSDLKKFFPCLFQEPSFLIQSATYYAHQTPNGNIFHVAFQPSLGTVNVVVTDKDYVKIKSKTMNKIVAIQGVKDSALYLLSSDNQVIRVMFAIKRSKKKKIYLHELDTVKCKKLLVVYPSINFASCPYRAIYYDTLIRIVSLECNSRNELGTVIRNKQYFGDTSILEKNAVMHRGYAILFYYGDERSCRKFTDRVIIVTSPLLKNVNTSMLHLVYSIDNFNYVYLLIPNSKTLLILDPTMLRFSENELLFRDGWNFEESDSKMINFIGINDGVISIGIPEFAIAPHEQNRQLISYYIWMGKIPKPIIWTTSDTTVSEEDANESKENNAKLIQEAIQARLEQGIARSKRSAILNKNEMAKPDIETAWNVNVPAFVPKVMVDEQTSTDENELVLLKEKNLELENQLCEQRKRVDKLKKRNGELKAEHEKKKIERAANLERLRNELQLLRESNNIMEKSLGKSILKNNEVKKEDINDSSKIDVNEGERPLGRTNDTDQESEESDAPDWDEVDIENTNFDDDMTAMVEATAKEFEERCGSGNKTGNEDAIDTSWIVHSPIVKPIGSEKRRKEKEDFILKNISSFVPDWSSSAAANSNVDGSKTPETRQSDSPMPRLQQSSSQPSFLPSLERPSTPFVAVGVNCTSSGITQNNSSMPGLPPSLVRPSTPFGALFSGENFTAWSKTEVASSGWDEYKGGRRYISITKIIDTPSCLSFLADK